MKIKKWGEIPQYSMCVEALTTPCEIARRPEYWFCSAWLSWCDHYNLRHQEFGYDEEGGRLARPPWHRVCVSRLQGCGHRARRVGGLDAQGGLGGADKPLRYDVPKAAGER